MPIMAIMNYMGLAKGHQQRSKKAKSKKKSIKEAFEGSVMVYVLVNVHNAIMRISVILLLELCLSSFRKVQLSSAFCEALH